MHRRDDPSPDLVSLATAQAGVVSLEQTELLGLGRHARQRLVSSGQWRRVDGPVYLTRAADPGWDSYAWAGVLLGGDDARIGGRAAGHLHGMFAEPPDLITVLVPLGNPIDSRPPWEFRRERPGVRSPRSPGSPPRLPIEDVVLDLCEGTDPAELVDLLTEAVGTRRTSATAARAAGAGPAQPPAAAGGVPRRRRRRCPVAPGAAVPP